MPLSEPSHSAAYGTSKRRLVLFDIDGTLLSTGGAARRAFHMALLELFGTAGPIENHSFSGKTDPQIVRELLTAAEIPDDAIDSTYAPLWEIYLGLLERELQKRRPRLYPGVTTLLARIEETNGSVVPGLLTGNIRRGACFKLEAAGVPFSRFPVGAFGSDHAERSELPAIAVQRAARLTGHHFAGKSVVVVGDTPADIACGENLGVRTVAVATGNFSTRQLDDCEPDYLFETLEEADAVWAAIIS